jgi:uncharacterized membrane protein required for colicin V production
MNPLDLVVLLLLALGLFSGARAGFVSPVLGLAGAVLGFGLALIAASVFRDALGQIEQPMRALVTLLGLAAFVLAGEAAGAALGATVSFGLRRSLFRPVDALGGAVVGVAHVVLMVWLFAGMLSMGLLPAFGSLARESVAVRTVTTVLPAPTLVAGRLLALLDTTDLPPLFAGIEPPAAAPVDLPADAEVRSLAQSAIASTGRVAATGCGAGQSVGSGFFIAPAYLVTNAHVVAGSSATTVTVGTATHAAVVVDYDDEIDLALLHVDGVDVAPLRLMSTAPGRGSTGAVLGFPGGGAMTVTAGAVTATHLVPGPNIYGEGAYGRTVVELRAEIRRGNSGGPLVVEPGLVGAIIFGASRANPEVGYAIGANDALEHLGPSIGATAPADTGACL